MPSRLSRTRIYAKAEAAIQQAKAENQDAPEILLLRGQTAGRPRPRRRSRAPPRRLRPHRGRPGAAANWATPRATISSPDLEKKRAAFQQQLPTLQHDGDYSKLRAAANQALALDPGDDDFLYYGGTVAALFRDPAAAKERLDRYLARSNSLRGDPQARDRALRILALLDAPPSGQLAGTPNWFSGQPLRRRYLLLSASAARFKRPSTASPATS